jgi:hypothetical protein
MAAIATMGQEQVILPREKANSATAAVPARTDETCIPVNAAVFMAAPPVENSTAAAMARNRADAGV